MSNTQDETNSSLLAETENLRKENARLKEREKLCETMDKAEKLALLRALQEIRDVVGLSGDGVSPRQIVEAVVNICSNYCGDSIHPIVDHLIYGDIGEMPLSVLRDECPSPEDYRNFDTEVDTRFQAAATVQAWLEGRLHANGYVYDPKFHSSESLVKNCRISNLDKSQNADEQNYKSVLNSLMQAVNVIKIFVEARDTSGFVSMHEKLTEADKLARLFLQNNFSSK